MPTRHRGRIKQEKFMAVWMYAHGYSFRIIATFRKMYERLKKWNVKIFFSDRYSVYRDLIPREHLIQTKAETHLIESNNFPQRHWFARFRRKTCCVSRSIEMIDLTMFLCAAFHVTNFINIAIWSTLPRVEGVISALRHYIPVLHWSTKCFFRFIDTIDLLRK